MTEGWRKKNHEKSIGFYKLLLKCPKAYSTLKKPETEMCRPYNTRVVWGRKMIQNSNQRTQSQRKDWKRNINKLIQSNMLKFKKKTV